jgi:serine/threonine-protein kinase
VVQDALPKGTTLLHGAYEVLQALGKGGFAITYLCQDKHLDRLVAIKEFLPLMSSRRGSKVRFPDAMTPSAQQEAKLKFLTEARVLSRLQHPNVVRVHSLFEENNTAYMVMEFLNGRSLAQVLAERGKLPEPEAIGYVEKIGEALAAVHDANFIHRDVKPENIILCGAAEDAADGSSGPTRPVLLDFGLNHELEQGANYGTVRLSDHIRFGTPGYAPPEQYGRQLGHGSYTDIYALGATLYHLLTGEVPVDAPERTYGVELPSPRALVPNISRKTDEAVMWTLQLQHDNRPQNVRDFLHTLHTAHRLFAMPSLALDDKISTAGARNEPDRPSRRSAILRLRQRAAAVIGSAGTRPASSTRLAAHLVPPVQGTMVQRAAVRTGRHLHAGLRDIWPNLVLVLLLIVAAVVVGKQQQSPTHQGRHAVTHVSAAMHTSLHH